MIVSKRDQQEIDALYAEYRARFGGRKEDYFGLMYLCRKFKAAPSDVISQVSIGANKYGLDGYFIDTGSRNLYLFQFRWTDNHNAFRSSLEQLTTDGLEKIFGLGVQSATHDPLLTRLKADLYEYKAAIDRVFIHFVFK